MNNRMCMALALIIGVFVFGCANSGGGDAAQLSDNTDLSGIQLSTGTLDPAFSKDTLSYTVTVPFSVESITVTASAEDPKATVSGPSGQSVNLVQGSNTIAFTVIAQDKKTKKNYSVTVIRTAILSNDTYLAEMTLSTGTLNPPFSSNIDSYTVFLENSVTDITITGSPADLSSTVGGQSGETVALNEGGNTITLTVTAEDGSVGLYVVDIYRTGTVPSDYNSPNIGLLKGVPTGGFLRDDVQYAKNISIITQPFRISDYEITRARFLAIMGTDPSNPAVSGGDDNPVQKISWYQAIVFCNKLSLSEALDTVYSIEGIDDFGSMAFADIPTDDNDTWNAVEADWTANGYRLPTEMEWQWAAMGAEDARYKEFAGDDGINTLGDCAVFGYDSMVIGHTTTRRSNEVGSKLPNELGIHDMSGNVHEFCWDKSAAIPDGKLESHTAAGKGSEWGSSRVMRGGAWNWDPIGLTVIYRDRNGPTSLSANFGFRVVRN